MTSSRLFRLECGSVCVSVTEDCGMLTADFDGIQPFSAPAWTPQECDATVPPLLRNLRGDFDCWFGANASPVGGRQHLPHGDPCNLTWHIDDAQAAGDGRMLQLAIDTQTLPGRVVKKVLLHPEHPVVYTQTLHRVDASLSVGHHAMVHIPVSGAYDVALSPFVYGSTHPEPFIDAGAKPRFAVAEEFDSLRAIPGRDGKTIDLNDYFLERGCDDLLMVSSDPRLPLAWTALTNQEEHYVYFALRDPGVLASTVIWCSHYGRDVSPWGRDGVPRHGYTLGLEDVTALFSLGIAESLGQVEKYRPLCERLHGLGVKTCLHFTVNHPPPVNYIMGAVPVPADFMGVADVVPTREGVELIDTAGRHRLSVPLALNWLQADAGASLSDIGLRADGGLMVEEEQRV